MARAKQTARTDARRRARIASRPLDAEVDGDDGIATDEIRATGATGVRSAATAARSSDGVPRRPGFGQLFGSFGGAYRRANVREDIALLPSLVRSRGFLAALGLILVGAILYAIFPGYSGSTFAFQFLTFPPALAPIFVAGFFAPRASYLLGLLVGLFDAIVYAVTLLAALPTLGAAATPDQVALYIGTALFWSAITGIVFGAGAAWYRRFLQSTKPRRPVQAGKGGSSRTQANRGRSAAPATGRRRF